MIYLLNAPALWKFCLFTTFPDKVDKCDVSVNQESVFKSLEDQSKTLVLAHSSVFQCELQVLLNPPH